MVGIGTVFAHGTLFQTDRNNTPLHTADGKITVALDLQGRNLILPVHRNGSVHARGVSLQADERPVRRFRSVGQAQINVVDKVLFHAEGDLFDRAELGFPFPDRDRIQFATVGSQFFCDPQFIGQGTPGDVFQ